MKTLSWPLCDRLAELAETFRHLKNRVRDAVATEMGKAVADAVRDWITAALRVRTIAPPIHREREYDPYSDPEAWDDVDPWNEEERMPAPPPIVPPEPSAPTKWAAALSVGAVVSRWLIARRLPLVPSMGVGALVVAVSLVGGPLIQASLAAAASAADLVRITRPVE